MVAKSGERQASSSKMVFKLERDLSLAIPNDVINPAWSMIKRTVSN
jgi:hypothetical protein